MDKISMWLDGVTIIGLALSNLFIHQYLNKLVRSYDRQLQDLENRFHNQEARLQELTRQGRRY